MMGTKTETPEKTPASAGVTTKDLAQILDTDPRTVRNFLRTHLGDGKAVVGKGARYTFERREVRSLTAAYKKWVAAREIVKGQDDEASTDES